MKQKIKYKNKTKTKTKENKGMKKYVGRVGRQKPNKQTTEAK